MREVKLTKEDIEKISDAEKMHIMARSLGDIFQHFKGDMYLVEDIIKHHETNEPWIVYKALYGDCYKYVRPLAEFFDWVEDREDNITPNKLRFEAVRVSSKKEQYDNLPRV